MILVPHAPPHPPLKTMHIIAQGAAGFEGDGRGAKVVHKCLPQTHTEGFCG